ncbi:ferritin family protein [candidate division KSB1 bacterium]
MEFKVSELIEMAINMEREGVEFYMILSKYAKSDETRKIFEDFAEDERKHEKFFRKMIEHYNIPAEETVEDKDIEKLIRQITHHSVFPEVKPEKIEDFHPLNAVKMGIKTEKNTVRFYKRLLKKIKDDTGRDALIHLIGEEESHMKKLTDMHKTMAFDF